VKLTDFNNAYTPDYQTGEEKVLVFIASHTVSCTGLHKSLPANTKICQWIRMLSITTSIFSSQDFGRSVSCTGLHKSLPANTKICQWIRMLSITTSIFSSQDFGRIED
jgi:phage anti-repressor protein